jgi:predicted dehydrogenase
VNQVIPYPFNLIFLPSNSGDDQAALCTIANRERNYMGNKWGKKIKGRVIRYAVVGLGDLAQVAVLPAFANASNSELLAIVSGDATKRNKLKEKYHLQHAFSYEQYDAALAIVDAVYLVLPNHLHREYAVRAAKAGVHVLCEKPMAVTQKDCEAMIQAARKNKVKLMIAYRLHFEGSNLKAMRLGSNGKLGDLRFFDSEFSQQVVVGNIRLTEPSDNGGGPVYDMGVYCINASRYLFRAEPISVSAFSASLPQKRFGQVEEMTSVVMRFPGERLATFTCSFGAASLSRYTLIGTKGLLTADPAYDYSKVLKQRITVGRKTTTKSFSKRDQFAAELIYFSNCISRNKQPEPSGLEGLADVRIVQAIYKSIKDGRTVKLSPFAVKQRPSIKQEIDRPAHAKPKTIKAQSPSGKVA